MSQKIEVETHTLIKFWLIPVILLAVWMFITKAWTGLLIVGAAIFLAIAIKPLSDKINKFINDHTKKDKDRNLLSNIIAFSLILLVVVLIIVGIGPVVVNETSKFVSQIPEMSESLVGSFDSLSSLGEKLGIEDIKGDIAKSISGFASGIVGNLGGIIGSVGGFFSAALMTIILTVFFLIEGPKLYEKLFDKLSDSRKDENVNELRRILSRMARVISLYVNRQVTIAVIDGIAVFIAVLVLSLLFGFSTGLAVPMGLISLVFYLIPMFGQIIGCAIISVILFISSPVAGAIYLLFYIIYAQIEGNFIATFLQGDAMNLSPLIILVAIVIGMYMAGLLGAIIAIPIAGCVKVFIEEIPTIRHLNSK